MKEYKYNFPRPAVTTDTLVFREGKACIEILLIKRKHEPYKDFWALPGGFLEMEETPIEGALRELREETGLNITELKEIGTFGEINRDPRGRTITIAFYTFVDHVKDQVEANSDAAELSWFSVKNIPDLAFDHKIILDKGKLKLKSHVLLAKLNIMEFFGIKKKDLENIFKCIE